MAYIGSSNPHGRPQRDPLAALVGNYGAPSSRETGLVIPRLEVSSIADGATPLVRWKTALSPLMQQDRPGP